MIRHLVMIATTKLNMFPAKGVISEKYSPHMILNQINWDHKKHCQYEFGSYFQASKANKPTNNNMARTVDTIYPRQTTNI